MAFPSLIIVSALVSLLLSLNAFALQPHVARFDHDSLYEPSYRENEIRAVRGRRLDAIDRYHGPQQNSIYHWDYQEFIDAPQGYHVDHRAAARSMLSKRSPARVNIIAPTRKKKSDPKAQERDQKKADDDALRRVKSDDDQITSQSQSDIDKAHKNADKKINALNDRQGAIQTRINQLTKEIKETPSTKGKSRSEQNRLIYKQIELTRLQRQLTDGHINGMRQLALQGEVNQDMNTIAKANKKGNDVQHHEFNDDGKAKSDGQKKAEDALAGFLKFLEYFGEIVSDLTMIFPGGGELLSLGLKLVKVGVDAAEAAKVGGTIAKIGKAYKGADKMKKAGDNINELRKMLGLKPGTQQIQGMNGQQMQKWQDYMVNKLLDRASKNIATDAKKVSDANSKTKTRPQRVGRMRGPK